MHAIQNCHYYLAGIARFKVWTDHRPLVGAFEKHLHLLQNQRLMRMREKLTLYNFSVIWTPGNSHHITDALSRAPFFGRNSVRRDFCASHGIQHELSSPYNPESNGLAEAAVKNLKKYRNPMY